MKNRELGVNVCEARPVGFKDIPEAVKQDGVFWKVINALPIDRVRLDETKDN